MPDQASVTPYFFHRDEVTRRSKPRPQVPGIRVTYQNGTVHFFPGGSVQEALGLLNSFVPEELRNHPQTRIEYGEKTGPAWKTEKTLKHPTTT